MRQGNRFTRPGGWGAGRGRRGTGCSVLTSKPGAVELSAQRDAVACSARGQAGKGASGAGWGSPLLRRTRREAPATPEERLPLEAICIWPVQPRTADACLQCCGRERGGSRALRGEQPLGEAGLACPGARSSISPAPSTLSHLPTPPLPPPHTLGLSVRWLRAWGQRCQQIHTPTPGAAQETVHRTREKTPAFLWEVRTCLGLLPIPEQQQEKARGGRGQGRGTVSGALPDTHSQGPPEVQVE